MDTQTMDGMTPAQRMAAQHAAAEAEHQPTVENVPDEDDIASKPATSAQPMPISAKAAGKRPETAAPAVSKKATKTPIDMKSEEAFPSLGAPKTQVPNATWGSKPTSSYASNSANGTSAANGKPVGLSMPVRPQGGPGQSMSMPGQYTETMRMNPEHFKAKSELRKPIPDLIRDINKKSKTKIDFQTADRQVVFTGRGPNIDSVQQTLKEVAALIGAKQTMKVGIPGSVRPFIIGRQGAVIQGISQRTGARIQMPKQNAGSSTPDEEEIVEIEIEGNPLAVILAKKEVDEIVNLRTSSINARLKDIPAEFFPFLAGAHQSRINAFEKGREVRVKVPHYHTWHQQSPPAIPQGNQPASFAPQEGQHILVSGEREAVRQVQEEIEAEVRRLHRELTLKQVAIERERHQFIVGQKGQELHDFLQETGCTVVLPPSHEPDLENIVVVGPADQIETAMDKVMDLASSMSVATVDVARQHPGSSRTHVRDVTRYLQQRRALEQLGNAYGAHINAPTAADGPNSWSIFARDGRNSTKARADLVNLVQGHPPQRFQNVNIHPFYHRELKKQHARAIRDQFGVHLVFPPVEEEADLPLLLVYEGPGQMEDYSFPRSRPSESDVISFQAALKDAERFLTQFAAEEAEIVHRNVDAPNKYREKIQRFVNRESQREPQPSHPVQFLGLDSATSTQANGNAFSVNFRGPAGAVDDYAQKLATFIEEQIRDEAERGYTISLDFPQKFANILIGRKGENINKLRDEFDVDLQVQDGKVEIKGPKAKADAAKAHIMSTARKLEDETTHILKIKPHVHRDLIGAKGSQVLRLQERYSVRINFPRAAASADDQSVADGASDTGGAGRGRSHQAPDEVIVRGPSRGADQAREELLSLYQYILENSHTATVSVSQSQLGSLIGSRGRELDNLRMTTGAQIDVPGSKDVTDPSGRVAISIKGSKSSVENARKLLEGRARSFDDTVTRSMEVDKRFHRALIGRDGENIRRIIVDNGGSEEARRIVQFPRADSQSNVIKLEGDKDVVEKIVATIQAFVAEREQQVQDTVEVPPEKHGGLIGRGGETRKNLESQFGVSITVPSTSTTGPERSQIKLEGLPEAVSKAKEHISKLVKEQEGTTVQVPTRLHHAIADTGNGNFFKNLSNNMKVTVDHAGHSKPPRPDIKKPTMTGAAGGSMPLITDAAIEPSDLSPEQPHKWEVVASVPPAQGDDATIPWVLKGSDKQNVAKAVQMVEKALAEADDSRTGYLTLPDPKTYRFVIGQAGSTVNSIRRETGCKIDVPKNSGAAEPIEIRGRQDAVEQAKQMIIEAVLNARQR